MRPRPILLRLSPALFTQLVNALIGFAISFGLLTLAPGQQDAVNNLLNVVTLILTGWGVLAAEGQVTPTSDPQLPEGTRVKTTDSTGAVIGSTRV